MSRLLVLCPTRGRPGAAQMMWTTFRTTAELPDTRLIFVVDRDDPACAEYIKLPSLAGPARYGWEPDKPYVLVLDDADTGDLVRATNTAAARFVGLTGILGHVGDDHRFRTKGWDRIVRDALTMPGMAYGDDLFQGEALVCGGVFITTDIVQALGWYALPSCRHLFIDNAWGDIGRGLGALRYLPDVVIEHLHPTAGKGEWDEMYRAYNSGEMFDHDRAAYEAWIAGPMAADLARVRAALETAA